MLVNFKEIAGNLLLLWFYQLASTISDRFEARKSPPKPRKQTLIWSLSQHCSSWRFQEKVLLIAQNRDYDLRHTLLKSNSHSKSRKSFQLLLSELRNLNLLCINKLLSVKKVLLFSCGVGIKMQHCGSGYVWNICSATRLLESLWINSWASLACALTLIVQHMGI